MKLLWVPQISTVDKKTGRFILDADSNIIVFKNYKEALRKLGVELTIVLPYQEQVEETDPLFLHSVNVIRIEYPKNVFESRFFLDRKGAMRVVLNCGIEHINDFDWAVINDPCLVAQWKILFKTMQCKTKIATINHWIDNPSYPKIDPSTTYAFRQLEGMYTADIALTCAVTGLDMINEMSRYWLSKRAHDSMMTHTHVLENPIDPNIYYRPHDSYFEKIMLFSHRCSSFPLYADNFNKFKAVCKTLRDEKFDFEVLVSNPSGYIFSDEEKKLFDNFGPFPRDYYIDILHQHPIMSAFFDVPPLWPTTLLEGAVCGCPVVVPNEEPYVSMFGANYIGNVHKNQQSYLRAFRRLLSSSDARKQMGIEAQEQMKRFTPELQAQKLLNILGETEVGRRLKRD